VLNAASAEECALRIAILELPIERRALKVDALKGRFRNFKDSLPAKGAAPFG
jgi:hypothetical protein